jgi:hypothetical protein
MRAAFESLLLVVEQAGTYIGYMYAVATGATDTNMRSPSSLHRPLMMLLQVACEWMFVASSSMATNIGGDHGLWGASAD